MMVGNPLLNLTSFQRQFFFESVWRYLHLQRLEDNARISAISRKPAQFQSATIATLESAPIQFKRNEKHGNFYGENPSYLSATPHRVQTGGREGNPHGPSDYSHPLGTHQKETSVAMLYKTTAHGPKAGGDGGAGASPGEERPSGLHQKDLSVVMLHKQPSHGSGEKSEGWHKNHGAAPSDSKSQATIWGSAQFGAMDGKGQATIFQQETNSFKSHQNPAAEGFEAASDAVFGEKSKEMRLLESQIAFVIDDYARGDREKARGALEDFQSRLSYGNYKSDDLMAVLLLVIEDRAWLPREEGLGKGGHFGAASATPFPVPQSAKREMQESSLVRLASVREMLRYYFEAHPKEYSKALAAALSITSDKEGDSIYLQERLASCLASIGSFALSQKILQQLKIRMDERKQLAMLGYRYDRKGRRLVLGKRTCTRLSGAKGILGLLVAVAKR